MSAAVTAATRNAQKSVEKVVKNVEKVVFQNPIDEANEDLLDEDGQISVKENRDVDAALQHAAFGSSVGAAAEEISDDIYKTEMFGLLHPDTPTRGGYDMFQLCIMLWLAWLLPTRLAFTKSATSFWEVAVDLVVDLSVWVDMFLQMRMYNYDTKTKKLITDKNQIKRAYLRSWFIIDFCSVVPVDQVMLMIGNIMLANTTSDRGIQWAFILLDLSVTIRMLRLLRLVRLVKIKRLLNMVSSHGANPQPCTQH
jgi:hypothetical protein